MRLIERLLQWFSIPLIICSVVCSPFTCAYFLSADHKIESPAVIVCIVFFQLCGVALGIIFLTKTNAFIAFFKKHFKDIILAGVVYALCEIVILSLGIFQPHPTPERIRFFRDFTVPQEELGYTMRPGLRNFEVTWLEDGVRGVYDSDEYGFRNVGISYATSSLFFIGDSFTQGSWVSRNEAYFAQVGKGFSTQAISYGIGGYGITQYDRVAKNILPKNAIKKTVVISFFANDLEKPYPPEKMKDLYKIEMLSQIKEPTFADRFHFKYSVLGQVKKVLFLPRQKAVLPNGLTLFTNRGTSISFKDSDYEVFEETLRSLFAGLKARSDIKNVLVILIPSREAVYQEEYEQVFSDTDYLQNEAYGYKMIEDVGQEYHIPVLNLTEFFRKKKEEKLYFDVDPHWNAEGHTYAANVIINWLKSLKISIP